MKRDDSLADSSRATLLSAPQASSGPPHSLAAACLTSLLVGLTKIFLGGFGWQAAAFASHSPSGSAAYAVATGLGDAVGTFVGNAILARLSPPRTWAAWRSVVRSGCIVASGSLLSGTAWQPLVLWLSSGGIPFTLGALLTGVACGAAFFVGINVAEIGSSAVDRGQWRRARSDVVKDLSLSVAVAGAATAFVGTDTSWHGNWLQQLVGERIGASVWLDCFKAGCSTLLGYSVLQLMLLAIVPSKYMWSTIDAPQLDIRNSCNRSSLNTAGRPSRALAPTWSMARGSQLRELEQFDPQTGERRCAITV
ncbi:hypothetical protein AB1Y20_021638 [Prymnesium parvum]|uniref:Transmembrane protein 163 n=1 Tax=Prymnesium parvum TaxID=97485 RepID=A0AB34JM72_PRYPA